MVWIFSKRLCLSAAATLAVAGSLMLGAASPASANHNNYRSDRWSSSDCDNCRSSYYAPTYSGQGRRHHRSYNRGYDNDCYGDRGDYRQSRAYHRGYDGDPYYHDRYRYQDRDGDRYYRRGHHGYSGY
jgi:hypothetical protein